MLERKKYKSEKPENTIQRIRAILNDIDLFVEESYRFEHFNLYSGRLEIVDGDLEGLNIGTNGKGTTKKYALASGYGEFMERLQNKRLFPFDFFSFANKKFKHNNNYDDLFTKTLDKNNLWLNHHYSSDEIVKSFDELSSEEILAIKKLLKIDDTEFLKQIIKEEVIYAPFYDVKKRDISYLPIKLLHSITSSNGMCAGNTYEEAIIQGICEIFERFSLSKIFTSSITPPNIPLETFKGTSIFNTILKMQEKGNRIIIKDCSLGIGLPVLGVLYINNANSKYSFHLGADLSPVTALERCLTELFQGQASIKFKNIYDIGNDSFDLEKNYFDNIYSGNGEWPESLFKNNFTYEFTGFRYVTCNNDIEDLNYLAGLISELNYSLYIRDVSFLNFPSFYVYIKGMSEIISNISTDPFKYNKLFVEKLNTFINIPNAEQPDIKELADILSKYIKYNNASEFQFSYYSLNPAYNHPVNYYLSLLYLLCADYHNAYIYLDAYIKENSDKLDLFYFSCLKSIFKYKSEGLSYDQMVDSLTIIYPMDLIKEIMQDLNLKNIIKNNNFSTCFDCSNCGIFSYCACFRVLGLMKKLEDLEASNIMDQKCLGKYFN